MLEVSVIVGPSADTLTRAVGTTSRPAIVEWFPDFAAPYETESVIRTLPHRSRCVIDPTPSGLHLADTRMANHIG